MKKTIVLLCVATVSALTAFGQGRVNFNNYAGGNAVTIGSPASLLPGEGTTGQNVGATYSVELFWAAQGSYANAAALVAASLGNSGGVPFFGTTGGNPGSDGAGQFSAAGTGDVAIPVGNYSMVALAWYNGGTFGSYQAAANAGANTGSSALFNLASVASPTPSPNTPIGNFTVQAVPEPGTMALLGLGAGALALIRRRKA